MTKFKSKFLQELEWRGFVSQITHEKELDEILSQEKICAYIGFDCTASSLHVGSLIQIMILRLLQKYQHKPLILLGGGTTKIGDPSGKDESRKFLDDDQIEQNLAGIHKTLSKFVKIEKYRDNIKSSDKNNSKNVEAILVGGDAALGAQILGEESALASELFHNDSESILAKFVNNDDWLQNLKYIEFLRNIGRHFSVNRMLSFESVKLRLDRDQPLSFLEFNYMILQAYDFYILNKKYGCNLQVGGSDQWGNIVNGVELTRRMAVVENDKSKAREVFGLTTPLLTTSDGKKMGKTANGAIWLDEKMLSPYDYFQYFRNVSDADVIRFLKLFTDLEQEEISELEKLEGQEINKAKEILAFETTKICHGEKNAENSLKKAQEVFINKNNNAFETVNIKFEKSKKLVEIIKECNATKSNGEARRLIQGRAVKINQELILDVNLEFENNQEFDLQVGKKKFYHIILTS